MKVLIAPDKFKGSLTAPEVCEALKKGLLRGGLTEDQLIIRPLSDGGEGLVEAITKARDGELIRTTVSGPLGEPVEAEWGWIEQVDEPPLAVIEMAAASGLALLDPEDYDPLHTSTRGTGELIEEATHRGATKILLGIGGSATVDGGLGMALALGFNCPDQEGGSVENGGGSLEKIQSIDDSGVSDATKDLTIVVACDVTNPLLGPEGAARVYAPQKGADSEMVEQLEKGMENWADRVEEYAGRSLRSEPGTGAAGGLGFGLLGLLGAELKAGAELVMDIINLNSDLRNADVLITGEGQLDDQTVYGKTPMAVARRAGTFEVDFVVGVAGSLGQGYEACYESFDYMVAIPSGPLDLEESMNRADELLVQRGRDLARLILANK